MTDIVQAPNRHADHNTSSLDMKVWHRIDRPECTNHDRWLVGPSGFRCVSCDWWCKA